MINQQLNDFYNNWLSKADSYKVNNLANHFDKFSSLYVLFNSLYMQVMTELVISGHDLPANFKDKKAATDYVIQYLGSRFYIETLLTNKESNNNLVRICEIIMEERFHIILNWGEHQRAKDLELLTSLCSNNKQKKAKAILSLFYHVRCNLFHGHKDYVAAQSELLIPTNHLLRRTVEIIFNKLTDIT